MIWRVPTGFGPLTLREQIEPDDEPGLLKLFADCDDWFEATTGGPSGPGDVQSLFYVLPDGASFEDKRLFTLRDEDQIVGVMDAVLRYPQPRSCAVGLFLVAPSHRRKGVATAVARVLLDEALAADLQQVTATVADGQPVGSQFLRSLGFDIGNVQPDSSNRRGNGHAPSIRRATLDLSG